MEPLTRRRLEMFLQGTSAVGESPHRADAHAPDHGYIRRHGRA